jgi:hypothetical protein
MSAKKRGKPRPAAGHSLALAAQASEMEEACAPEGSGPMRSLRRDLVWVLPGLVVTAVLLAILYSPAIDCGLFFDEQRFILEREQVRNGQVLEAFRVRPLRGISLATYALTHARVDERPAWWRASQVVLHGITALALGGLVWSLTGGASPRHAAVTVLAATGLFALHPLAVESAVYVWARPSVLYTLFAILAMALIVGLFRAQRPAMRWAVFAPLLGLVLLLTLFTKEVGIVLVLPMAVLTALLWGGDALRRPGRGIRRLALPILAGSVLLILCAAGVLWFASSGGWVDTLWRGVESRFSDWSTTRKHWWTMTASVQQYLRLLIPWPGQYAVSHLVVPPSLASGLLGIALVAGWIGLIACAVFKRSRLVALGLTMGLLGLFPYIVLPSRAVVEYKAYPLLAGAALVVAGILLHRPAVARRWWAIAVLSLVLGLSSVSTWWQTNVWSSPISVWRHAMRVYPRNPEPPSALVAPLLRVAQRARDQRRPARWQRAMEEAAPLVEQMVDNVSLLWDQHDPLVKNNWAWTLDLASLHRKWAGRPAQAEALLRDALRLNRAYFPAHRNLISLLVDQGRLGEARQHLEQAEVHIAPHDRPNYRRLKREVDALLRPGRGMESSTPLP